MVGAVGVVGWGVVVVVAVAGWTAVVSVVVGWTVVVSVVARIDACRGAAM